MKIISEIISKYEILCVILPPMMEQLLYIGQQSSLLDILIWVAAGVLFVVGIVLAFQQQRAGMDLQKELEQLDKVKARRIEYEFVLKAMQLTTWHIEVKTRQIFYDSQFRGHLDTNNAESGTFLPDSVNLLAPEDAHRVLQALDDICTGRSEEYHQQYRVRMLHSNQYYWEESYAIISKRDVDGQPETVVGTSMRIDERKAMEQALIAARNRAEESDRLKSAFVANMSHEIRTPLNAIIGFTSVLPEITDEAERRQTIDLIQENNQKLLRIIDDVMNISKIEAGKVQMVMATFDVMPILSEVVGMFRDKAPLGVELSVAETGPQEVTTDMVHLIEVLNQLVGNALKFTSQGQVTLGCSAPENGKVRIWVRDTGKGIAEKDQEKVFERFYKVDEFVPGAGLGLSICRTIAYSLGGKVGLESKLGEGSTFWIELPA